MTIRASKSKKDSETNLCNAFGFTQLQAEAIVELMLYRLTGLEIKTFEKEYKELEKTIKGLKAILENEAELLKVIKRELCEVKEKHGDKRRTQIVENDEEAKIDIEELIIVEDTMVSMSNEGYIKRVPLKSYNRSNTNVEDIEYREGDFNKYLFSSNTIDTIMFFTDKGNMYQIKGSVIPEFKWKEKGERIDSIIKGLDFAKEKVVAVNSVSSSPLQKDFVMFTNLGNIKRSGIDKFVTNYSKVMALKLRENERLIDVQLVDKEKERGFLKILTSTGLKFSLEEPELLDLERSNLGTQLFNLSFKNQVTKVEYTNEYEFKSMVLNITKDGIISNYDISKYSSKKENIIQTNSLCRILIFSSSGKVYNIPSYILENLSETINLENLVDDYDAKAKIIGAVSIVNFQQDMSIYFVSKKGLVKRTMLSEFVGEYSSTLAYKLKGDSDKLISVIFNENDVEADMILITKSAMCIRFECSGINYMGRSASGVTGITLQEYDEVCFGDIVPKASTGSKVTLISSKAAKQEFVLSDIKTQNRAGRGKNLILVVMDDFLKEVKLKK